MDEADFAQANQAQFERLAIERQRAAMPGGESAEECEDCGEPIPEKRRQVMPGCKRCICCQEHLERSIR